MIGTLSRNGPDFLTLAPITLHTAVSHRDANELVPHVASGVSRANPLNAAFPLVAT